MQAAGLPRDPFELVIEPDGVALQLRDVRIAVQSVESAGCMPGRSRRELVALDEHDVEPTGLGQVIQHAATNNAATDDGYSGMCFHFWIVTVLSRPHLAKNYAPVKKIFGDGLSAIWRNRDRETLPPCRSFGPIRRPGRSRSLDGGSRASSGTTVPDRARRPRGHPLREFRGTPCSAGVHSGAAPASQLRVPGGAT